MKHISLSLLLATVSLTPAQSADPIVGNWLTYRGQTAAITPCSGGFCVTLKTGKYAGKQIGIMRNNGKGYAGKITDPSSDRTYNGKATLSGAILNMKGCVLGGLICSSQKWTRK
ncbi:MAG: DUF2147 domain-containing protein [Alphaproteobacteria bacterium]|nr:DUF2147 domain-containing protein [Alphaproteobacteria bacterium]